MARTSTDPPQGIPGRFSPARAGRFGIHYSWVMVGITFVLLLVAAGVRSAPAVMIKPLESDFGWSRGDISYPLSVSLLTLGLAGPVAGWSMQRFGIRPTTLVFLVITAIGLVSAAVLTTLWQMYLFWGVFVGFGTGGMSIVMSASVANMWFETRRGLVTGVLGGASSAGQFVFFPALIAIVHDDIWRPAVWLLAAILILIALPLSLLLLRSRPADAGASVYGSTTASIASRAEERVVPPGEWLRSRDFWLLASSFGVCGFTTIGLIGTHFIPHATEHGFSDAQAAGILSVMGAMNIVGTIGSGWLTDRYSPRRLLAMYYFFRACTLLALPLMINMPLMSLFAITFGLDYIATVPPTVMLTANRFGRRNVGTIYGWITCSHMVGGALAAALAGYIHDVSGDYLIPIYISGVLALIAAAAAFNIGGPRKGDAPPAPKALEPAAGY